MSLLHMRHDLVIILTILQHLTTPHHPQPHHQHIAYCLTTIVLASLKDVCLFSFKCRRFLTKSCPRTSHGPPALSASWLAFCLVLMSTFLLTAIWYGQDIGLTYEWAQRQKEQILSTVLLYCVTGGLVAPDGRFTLDFHLNEAFVGLQTGELCE